MYTCTYILLLIVSSLLFTGEKANSLSGLKDIPEETSTSARINFAYAGVLYSASDNKGFPDSLLQYHEFLILNSRININEEEDFLKKLPESFGKSYLTGLIEKRKGNFETSFDMLFGLLKYSPVYLEYYDELVYLSEINNKTILLRDFISHESTADKTDSSSAVKEYLRALIFSSGGEYKKSKSILENLVNKFAVRVPILLQLSNVQRNLGDYKKAFNTLSIIDKKFTYSGLKVLNAQGALYYLSGKYDEAKKTYLEELKFSRKLNALRYESKTLVNLGILLDEEGRVDSARAYYLTAVKSAEEINDSETKAFAYSELGVSYSFTGMLIEARKSYNESFELYKNLGNKVRLSFLSNNLGKIYLSMFNYYSALDYFKKGIEFAGENKRALVLNLIGTADVYANISNYTKALEYYERAKQLSSDIRDVTLLTDVNIGLGTLNLNLNLTANAVKYFHAADDLCRSNGGNASLSADIYNKCGILYANADSLDKAEKYFTRAIGFARQYADNYTEISSMLELAEIFISRGQAQKASLILKDIRQNPQLHSYDYLMIQSEMTLGKLNTFRKNYTEALKNFNKAAKAGKLLQESNLQIEADIEIAKILKEQELYEQAEKYYMDAFQLVQTVSRSLYHNKEVQIAYFSSKNDVYSSLADLYLSRNEFEKAFEVIESSRSRNTIQNLNNLMVQSLLSNRETLDKLYDYEWLLNSGLMSSTKLDSVRKEYDLYKMQLFKREPRLKDFLGQKNDLRIPEIQKELAKDEFVLSMFSEDSNTFLFLLSGNDFKTIKTGIRQKELLRLIENISPYFNSPAFKTESYFNQDLFSDKNHMML